MSHANDVMQALIAKVQQLESQGTTNADLAVDPATLAQADALLAGTPAPATTGGTGQTPPVTQPLSQPVTTDQTGQVVAPPTA